jgi:hypothetical protein
MSLEDVGVQEAKRFILTSDDDGHWYVIPADKQKEFDTAIENFDEVGSLPDWAKEVGGSPSRVTFTGYKIG